MSLIYVGVCVNVWADLDRCPMSQTLTRLTETL